MNSAEAQTPFTIDLFNIGIGGNFREIVIKESVVGLELVVSLHLSLGKLCPPQSARFDLPPALFSGTKRKSGVRDVGEPTAFATIGERLVFDLAVRDLPRATRVLFRLVGLKKKGTTSIGSGSNSSNTIVPLGWAAATLFDFKGCLDCNVKLFFFPGSVENPISTTLSNVNGEEVATTDRSSNSAGRKDSVISSGINTVSNLTAMMAPDLVLASDSSTPRVRVVHSMPNRGDEPIEGERAIRLSDAHMMELDRILMLSFNPLSMNMITDADRDFLWEIRYSILNRADLLPAFVMAVRWENAEHVQELYDLLDLWEPPSSPVQALQLLDRRFMDPKVRAFAAHCLEELSDEELSLYMLQLCQQLKFENYIDSALSRFLLRRALMNKKLIGHMYFWLLESEVYNKDVRKRFVILLQV